MDHTNSIVRFFIALEVYSQFVRNLEFVDKEQKQEHLRECLNAWEMVVRGFLSGLREVTQEAKQKIVNKDKPDGQDLALARAADYVESLMKCFFPTYIAELAYQRLGTEKLVDFVEEIASDQSTHTLQRLMAGFILLELAPERGLAQLRNLSEGRDTNDWIVSAIAQRLYAYYSTRPLSVKLKESFENLVSNLQLRLSGERAQMKGKVLADIRKHAFKEGQD